VVGDEQGVVSRSSAPLSAVIAELEDRLRRLPARLKPAQEFLATYQRTTAAVGQAIEQDRFEDPQWVEHWDVVFADRYLAALDAELAGNGGVPRPWSLAFGASADLSPVVHVLLGINAHVNYDQPQTLLDVISEEEFTSLALVERRRRDHERIDAVLASRVSAEDHQLSASVRQTLLDRLLRPLNRAGSRRFLREARHKVWHNTLELNEARVTGPDTYAVRLAELEDLSAQKIAELVRPGQVLLRLAVEGFGITLPPTPGSQTDSCS